MTHSSKQGEFHPLLLTDTPDCYRDEPLDSYSLPRLMRGLFKMPRPISKLALTNCLDKHFNHRLRLFCVHQFYILCTPSLLPPFGGYHHYYGYIRPCCWFVKVYYILRVLRLMIPSLCLSYVLVILQTILPIQHIQPAQVLQFRLCACL